MGKKGVVLLIIILVIIVGGSIFGYFALNNQIKGLYNNKIFSQNADKVSKSTVLLLVEVDQINIDDKMAGAIYVDQNGKSWNKGTAFSIGDGLFLTASHVLDKAEGKHIKLIWGDKEYDNFISTSAYVPAVDFRIFRADIDIPSIELVKHEEIFIGSKVGFVGFPLNEKNLVLNDGVISSIKGEQSQDFWVYTINSFLNRGNSGGPVFLSDTGEVVGIISSRQVESIYLPEIDKTEFTAGEKALYEMQLIMAKQLVSNSQIGIGNVIGINKRSIDKAVTYCREENLI